MRTRALAAALAVVASLAPQTEALADEGASVEASEGALSGWGATSDVHHGEVAVDLVDDVTAAEVADLAARVGITLDDNSPATDDDGKVFVAHVDPAREEQLLRALAGEPRVEAAEPMAMARALFVPNDPSFAKQWHLARVGAEGAWELGCGRGVTVAVIDTGIACYDDGPFTRVSDLGGTRCVAGYNFVGKNALAADDHGHGTHVAGTIAQTTHNGEGAAGLAHCARLMPVKVLSRQGFGTMADVAEGIRFAADHGADVVNLSLGSPQRSRVVELAVRYALAKGVVVVAAAGNSGGSVGYPAAIDGVVAVSATDRNDKLAWFSSRGPQVSLAAPGVAVLQQTVCDGGLHKCSVFGAFNGTSMAAPHVAGVAALLVGEGVTRRDAVVSRMSGTARAQGPSDHFGAGIVDASSALRQAFLARLLSRAALLVFGALLVFRRIRARGGRVVGGAAKWVFALALGTGVAPFLPLVGISARAGRLRPVCELLARPLADWSVAFSAHAHQYAVLALPAVLVGSTALLLGVRRLRGVLGGASLGAAAYAAHAAIAADQRFALGAVVGGAIMVVTAGLGLWIARVTLDESAR